MGIGKSKPKTIKLPKGKHKHKKNNKKYNFKNLVIEGGGVKITAACGTIKAMFDSCMLDNIENYVGSSAGAIGATLLCCGYTPAEAEVVLLNTDFNNFLDDSFGFIRDTIRLCNEYGICRGKYFQNWADKIIKKKTGKAGTTFKELFEMTKKKLFITALCVEDNRTHIFSIDNAPTMPVCLAVRMSMSIPYLFAAVDWKGKHFVDGGISDNYPIHLFDKNNKPNYETIGVKLMGNDEKRNDEIFTGKLDTNNIFSFSVSIITHLMDQIERSQVGKGYWERTISSPTGNVSTFHFSMGIDEKKKIMKIAYESALEQIAYHNRYGKFKS